jgi:hypothetical protein
MRPAMRDLHTLAVYPLAMLMDGVSRLWEKPQSFGSLNVITSVPNDSWIPPPPPPKLSSNVKEGGKGEEFGRVR